MSVLKKSKKIKQLKKEKLTKEQQKLRQREKRLYNTYGITGQDWQEMFISQGGVCWICEKIPASGRLCVEHRHVKNYKKLKPEDKKKEVRGLVCFFCNKYFIGGIERSSRPREILERLNEYFTVFKMKNDPDETIL